MTDPLDDLKRAFDSATPAPEAAKKADHLARAQEIYDRIQGSADAARPIPDRPNKWAGILTGVGQMFSTLTSRPALTASTALVAVGLVALVPILRNGPPEILGGIGEQPPAVLEKSVDTDEEVIATPLVVFVEPEPAPVELFMADESAAGSDDRMRDTALRRLEQGHAASATQGLLAAETQGSVGRTTVRPAPMPRDVIVIEEPNTEVFANEDPNPVKIAIVEPVSTFSIDVDTASYSVLRSSLMNGQLPDPQSVRIEEMVNYFPYAYPAPDAGDAPFRPTVSISPTPWNPDTQLLHIALQGRMPAIDDRPPLNLVFLIDTSGSMDQPDKLPLLKQSFRLMLGQLRAQDQVAIVTYAGSAGQVLDPTPASDRATILAALNRLDAGGSTAGQAGLQQAYATAEAMAAEGEVTRVILATDGDFNVGLSDPEALKDYIADKRDSGTYLSVLGFGRGNLDDATMQALAQNGNGQAAYIDTLSEAQKVLVDQLTGALFPIANDVKIQIEFNPTQIAEYRLIGYETRALRREDFNNDKVDAGEIGAGHSVTAIYEITPVGSPAVLNDPLRYAAAVDAAPGSDELAFLRLRYKEPGAETSQLIEVPISAEISALSADAGFAAAIAGFGQLLQNGSYTGDWSYADAIALADSAIGDDPFGYRREAITLMRLAQSLSE